MKKIHFQFALIFSVLFMIACQVDKNEQQTISDPLPSWNEGVAKDEIIQFVETSTDPLNANYIEIEDRIATFDNDGTLWSEQPMYFQLSFAIDRIKAMAADHPEWNEEEPYKSVLNGDLNGLMEQGMHGLLTLVMATHAGITTDEFDAIVEDWLKNAKHPKFNKPYNELVYQPMLELLEYLRKNNFKTFIVSGGGIDFMRVWTEEVYGIPKNQVFGSSIKTKFDYNNGQPVIRRLAEIDFIDDKEGKPAGIQRFIGRRPVFAAGNSDGDLQMVQWTTSGEGQRFGLYIHHTDAEREYAYDRVSSIGHFDKAWDEAKEKGWTIVDMKTDWKVIYPFELDNKTQE